ncbi:MAG: hypothetical protein M3Z64_04190 [Verrucomicrobiota bacterium]|nr:hypothetical protein [Verrucomicrobiota bacterium]
MKRALVTRVLALRSGRAVGRIMGIINQQHNEQQQERTARFFNLDCVDDSSVSHALIAYVEQWARANRMDRVIGPFGFSEKDPQGLQIEGFEHLPVIAAPSNPPFLQGLVEQEGYRKLLDCVSFRLPITRDLPPLYEKIARRVTRGGRVTLVELSSKKELKPYVIPTLRLVNETYANIFGFIQMSEEEMKQLAAQYMPVLDADFVKLAKDANGELIGFILGIPDMSLGIQRAKGRLWPFGFLHLLAAARRTKQLNLMLGAVREDFRGSGVHVLLGKTLIETAKKRGFEVLDSHLVLESNRVMCSEYLNFGAEVYKRFRVYQKSLEGGMPGPG